MKDAFEKIAEDADGLYRITFRPQMLEADGSWHTVSVEVRSPRVHAKYATYYVAPTAENRVEYRLQSASHSKEAQTPQTSMPRHMSGFSPPSMESPLPS